MARAPLRLEVHTPPCLVQNKEVQARAGISAGLGSQVREKGNVPAAALTTDQHVCGRSCCGAEHACSQRVNLARLTLVPGSTAFALQIGSLA